MTAMNQTMKKTGMEQRGAVSRRPEVNVIPATKRSVESGGQIKKQKSLRVAAYCRVSTGDESQQTSYTTQRKFYTELITSKPGWTLAGIYADEAISGTSRAKRKQFNIMMEDAVAGRIDYIVTKSISRFARNTVDTLNCVRQLRQLTSTNLGSSWGAGMTAGTSGAEEDGSEAAIYASLAADIRIRLEELKKERDILESEQGATSAMQKNYEFFLRCLTELPEKNDAGMKMNVNGLDVEGSIFRDMDGKAKPGIRSGVKSGHIRVTEEKIAALPDYLRFEKGIYIAFIKSGEVDGDTVVYKTNFGVKLLSIGNSRNLSSFLGFRRANPDGTIELLDEKWKVRGLGVCYSRRKVGEKRKSLSRKTE